MEENSESQSTIPMRMMMNNLRDRLIDEEEEEELFCCSFSYF